MKYIALIAMTLIMALAFVVTGQFIKDGLIQIRSADRFVTVKGLAERNVKSDLAIWPIEFKVADNVLENAQGELDRQTETIRQFLAQYSIGSEEISVDRVMVNDARTQQYQNNNNATRYTIEKTMTVRTNNVEAVARASQNIGSLVAQGVLIGFNAIPQYSFTKLNDIKPDMIAAATKNARKAAQQFANDSGASVGDIRSASQGYFSIDAREDVNGLPASAALYKKVRVVSTVDYYLDD